MWKFPTILGFLLLSCSVAQSQVNVLRVAQLPTAPDNPLWLQLRGIKTTLFGLGKFTGKQLELEMKAVHNGKEVVLYFRWPDQEPSLVKEAWQFDGANWKRQEGDEDRIALFFPITQVAAFNVGGCAGLCHASEKGGYMATNSPGERVDLWHWKSYRSNPLGFADDGYASVLPENAATGRMSDKGGGGDKRNETTDKTKPRYMQDPAKKPTAPGFLIDDEKVEIKDYSIFKAGDVIPYRILTRPSGDRGDIRAQGVWQDGYWTVVLHRKLNTGSPNDAVLQPGQSLVMGVAVYDNAGGADKYASLGLLSLVFGR